MTEEELRANISSTYDIHSFCCNNDFYEFIVGINKIFVESKKMWGLRTANQWLEQELSRGFYLNDKNIAFFDEEENDDDELYEDEEFFNPIDDLISVGFYEDEVVSEDQSL